MEQVKRYLANHEVSLRDEGDDGALLFNPDTNGLLVINPTGRTIWQFLSAAHTRDEIAAYLVDFYQGVTLEQALQDSDAFLQALGAEFILETADAAA